MKDEPYLKPEPPKPNIEACWIGVEPYSLGRNTYVGTFSHIAQHTTVGSFTSIGNLCTIGAQKHPIDALTSFPFIEILKAKEQKDTIIGSDVWIGCNAVVLEGVVVGHGAVIGAGAIVTKNVPPYAIVVGNPARVLKYRFTPELIFDLLATSWWDLPAEEIQALPMADPAACVKVLLDRKKAA